MSTDRKAGVRPFESLRAGVVAAAVGVAACFGAALTFADQPLEAAETAAPQR